MPRRLLLHVLTPLLLAFFTLTATAAPLKVGVSDWPGWVAWYVAQEKGFLKRHGAEVELVWFPNYTDSIQALSAGQLDANSQTWSDTLAPLAAGIPLKVVLVNDNSAGNDALMVVPSIKSFADLKGKSVALEQFSISHFVLATALARNGMRPEDVKVVNLAAGDAAAAFIGGRVPAAVVWNPWVNQIQASGKGKPLFTSKDMPGLVPDLLVARAPVLNDAAKRATLLGMVRAWYKTVDFIAKEPQQAAKIMAKVVGLPAPEYATYLSGTRFFGEKDNLIALGEPKRPESLVAVGPTITTFLKQNKLLEGNVDFAGAVDPSLVREAAGMTAGP